MSNLGLLRQPNLVVFGAGKRDQIPYIAQSIAKTVLLVTDLRMSSDSEFLKIKADLELAGLKVFVFNETLPDLPRENIQNLVKQYGKTSGIQLDALIAIGGGSCLDMAKVASVAIVYDQDISEYYGEFLVPGKGLPVITVPTTGGTGAEVTCISVVYDQDKKMKLGIASPYLEPFAAIIDPELTLTCPPGLTAATAADALSHLIESFTAKEKKPSAADISSKVYVGKNSLTDIFASNGLRLINKSIESLVHDSQSIEARSDIMMAAFNAGMSINTTGTAGIHAIQSPMGTFTNTPHGFGVGALLPYMMRYNMHGNEKVFAEIATIFNIPNEGKSEIQLAREVIVRIEELLKIVGCPLNLKDIGIRPEHFRTIAKQAMLATRLTVNNPRTLTEDHIEQILQKAYDQDLSWWDVE